MILLAEDDAHRLGSKPRASGDDPHGVIVVLRVVE